MAKGLRHRSPSVGRDSSWLVGADLLAVLLAFLGQIILARMLLAEHYGWMVIVIDVYASMMLVVDLGLPTLLARDGARAPDLVPRAVHRMYRYQLAAAVPFLMLAGWLRPESWLLEGVPDGLVLAAMLTAVAHVASYAPRSGLRVLGEARLEALTKVVERTVTVGLYGGLALFGSTSPSSYLSAFCTGAVVGWLAAYLLVWRVAPPSLNGSLDWGRMDASWLTHRSLIVAALPFAVTLGVLPYVVRIEKFLVTAEGGATLGAVFHVAQLAWLAGLVVPSALRSALLPVLGDVRRSPVGTRQAMNTSLDLCFGLLPFGLLGGYAVVAVLAPVAFPSEYVDGTHGASAVEVFTLMLLGWGFTLLATPSYTAIMTGENPWRFTGFIFGVLVLAVLIGYVLIVVGSSTPRGWLMAGGLASSMSAGALLVCSWWLSGTFGWVRERADEWALVLLCTALIVVGLVTSTWWWVLGLPLLTFTPSGWRALRSTLA